jgi:putative ABC transport system permease protein
MRLLRNLARRRLRTGLTIAGITIGIWALVIFSSMANKINTMVAGDSRFYADKIAISGDAIALGDTPMRLDLADQLGAIDGVDVVAPVVTVLVAGDATVRLGPPDQILSSPIGADEGREVVARQVLAAGRALTAADDGRDVAVVGADIAMKRSVGVGDTVLVRDRPFEIVGVLEPTKTVPDRSVIVSFSTAQQFLHDELPPVVRYGVAADAIVSQFLVYPTPGADVEAVAAAIEARVPDVTALTGAGYDAIYGASANAFNAIIVGIAVISLIVGGMSIINTMAMSVAERTREIGIRRAIGASRRRVIRELMTESGVIGAIGGLVGATLGAVIVLVINDAMRSSGTILFELSAANLVFAVGFSTVLGIVAGLFPAWSAARLDPVAALRYE